MINAIKGEKRTEVKIEGVKNEVGEEFIFLLRDLRARYGECELAKWNYLSYMSDEQMSVFYHEFSDEIISRIINMF